MEQSPFLEANKSSTRLEILHTLWNQNVYYPIRKSPPPTFLYPEPNQSSPCPTIPLLEDPFLYCPPIYI